MPKTQDPMAFNELEAIRKRHRGILKADDVVEAATSEMSPLHKYFEWDDSEAARQHRLWQARELIRYVVTIIPNHTKPVTAYVSLKGDRSNEGGGYRALVDVMSDADQRKLLLMQALDDLEFWKAKYEELNELVPVFKALERVRAKSALAKTIVSKAPARRLQPAMA